MSISDSFRRALFPLWGRANWPRRKKNGRRRQEWALVGGMQFSRQNKAKDLTKCMKDAILSTRSPSRNTEYTSVLNAVAATTSKSAPWLRCATLLIQQRIILTFIWCVELLVASAAPGSVTIFACNLVAAKKTDIHHVPHCSLHAWEGRGRAIELGKADRYNKEELERMSPKRLRDTLKREGLSSCNAAKSTLVNWYLKGEKKKKAMAPNERKRKSRANAKRRSEEDGLAREECGREAKRPLNHYK